MFLIFLFHFLWAKPVTIQGGVCVNCSSQPLSNTPAIDNLQQVIQGSILNSNCSTQTQQRVLGSIIKGQECLQKIGSTYAKDVEILLNKKIKLTCHKDNGQLGSIPFAMALPSCISNKQTEIKINEQAQGSEEDYRDATFHEFLHLIGPEGHPHAVSVDMTQACPKCCFYSDNEKGKKAACRICRGEFKSITPEYLLTLFESDNINYSSAPSSLRVISATFSAFYSAADKKPFLRILPRILSGNSGFFKISESLYKAIKSRKIYGDVLEPIPPDPNTLAAQRDQFFEPDERKIADQLSEALVSLLDGNPEKAKEVLKIKIDQGTAMSHQVHSANLYSFQRALASFLAKYERENPPRFATVKSILGFDTQSWIDKHPTIEYYMGMQSIEVFEKTKACEYIKR